MNCHKCRSLIDAYVDGELSGLRTTLLERHLNLCPECGRELDLAKGLGTALVELRDFRAPESLEARVQTMIEATPATAVRPRVKSIRRFRSPALIAAGLAAVVFALISYRGQVAMASFRSMERAIAEVRTLHMTCLWVNNYSRQGPPLYAAREVWYRDGEWRLQEYKMPAEIYRDGNLYQFDAARQAVVNQPLAGGPPWRSRAGVRFQEIMGDVVRIENHPYSVGSVGERIYEGKTVDVVELQATNGLGLPVRITFYIDPATHLPVHGDQDIQQEDGWQHAGTLEFEFDKPMPDPIFDPTRLTAVKSR